jgi:DNA-binding NtrC family response regulator
MQQLYSLAERVGPTNATVLLMGETGTGKDVLANALHQLSDRREQPFIAVNCAAMSKEIIESELFGHERGSFTGAERMHHGCVERAGGGTLFLDEITEIPLQTQVKLLRVLEAEHLTRVGGETLVGIDARIIAATNRSPQQAVEEGTLRADLYHRLNVFPLHLPPLRAREGDVLLLTRHFLEKLNRQMETAKHFSEEALEALCAYDWPGNVRQLKHAIEQSFILADDEIAVQLLPAEIRRFPSREAAADVEEPRVSIHVGMTLADARRRLILFTLNELDGDKQAAADALGLSLKTLYNRLNEYSGAPETCASA